LLFVALETIAAPLARVAEVRALRVTAISLLNSYVGHQAGERILAGRIRRGDVEDIRAVIWLSDMRGFTRRADTVAPASLIELLNLFYDNLVPAIEAEGGEVLKFMGDGLLAIFRISESADLDAACASALRAAKQAQKNIAALPNAGLGDTGEALRFGLALHVGEALYGNIGAGARLDFTCIGLRSISPRAWKKSPPVSVEPLSLRPPSPGVCRENSSRWATSNSPDFANRKQFSGFTTRGVTS
jgi:adenylate cyclase